MDNLHARLIPMECKRDFYLNISKGISKKTDGIYWKIGFGISRYLKYLELSERFRTNGKSKKVQFLCVAKTTHAYNFTLPMAGPYLSRFTRWMLAPPLGFLINAIIRADRVKYVNGHKNFCSSISSWNFFLEILGI